MLHRPLPVVRAIADGSGYAQPDGERRSRLLVDGAQLVPSSFVDVQALDVDYLSFSFHTSPRLAEAPIDTAWGRVDR